MIIPKSFKLGGLTVNVKFNPAIQHDEDKFASASYRTTEITLMPSTEHIPRPQALIEQDFCHELVHHITYHAGDAIGSELKEHLHRNEGFVNLFALLLHQALTTMEYE